MEPLLVDVIHFYPKENAQVHHTERFEAVNDEVPKTTIVRRGQPFDGVIRFNRPYDDTVDVVQLIFSLGDNPRHETQGSMFLKSNVISDKHAWTANITANQDDSINFQVSSPITTPVGSWALRVVTKLTDAPDQKQIFDFDEDFYILFNPWNQDDQTYMENCGHLDEYIQNDVGKVWVGPIRTCRGKPWLYGQFDAVVLPACMFMLDRAQMPFNQRGDPVKVSRVISKIVNSNDDQGVLIGRWDGEYADGTAPSSWTGSVDILQQYLETQSEVPYGQCWVFAGVVTTVCRALGIPSRVVSNLVSAHDANCSLSVDKYYNEDMSEIEGDPTNPDGKADSIWNYHVWNDAWMARPDLPPGYGGWQAIDATPQETSMGMFQCGPASLEAIKQGKIGLGYDVEFMLASVNADLMRWRFNPEEETGFSMVQCNEYHIGRQILTKKRFVFDPIGDEDREDITHEYKHKEGSASERQALYYGVGYSERAKRYYAIAESLQQDVKFALQEIDVVNIGEPFRLVVTIDNNSNEPRNINATLSTTSVFYNGVRAEVLKKAEGKLYVGPGKHEELSIVIEPEEYLPKLVEYSNIKISASCIVDETKQTWAENDDFQVVKPSILIKLNEDLIVNQQATATLSFTNPLNSALTGCSFKLSGHGIAGRTLQGGCDDAPLRSLVTIDMPIIPNKTGLLNLVATFNSNELHDVNGAATVEVYEG